MRIYYLSHSDIPSHRPSSLQVMKTCESLVQRGHEVVLFGFKNPHIGENDHLFYDVEETFQLVKFRRLNIRVIEMTVYARQVVRSVKALGVPDLFFAREGYSLLAAARFTKPLFYEVHQGPGTFFKQWVESRIFLKKNFLGLVAMTETLKHYYLRTYPILSPEKILVRPNGAELPPEKPIKPLLSWPGRTGHIQVGYVGNLGEDRGPAFILSLAARNPEMDFHLVGGSEKDIAHWKRVSLRPNVYFHGFIRQRNLPAYYKRFDLMIAPYKKAIFTHDKRREYAEWISPLKIFEYMAYGKPILCSSLPVIGEVLVHGKNAWLSEPENLEDWQRSLQHLSRDAGLRRSLGEKARCEFFSRHTWDERARQIDEFIQKKISSGEEQGKTHPSQ